MRREARTSDKVLAPALPSTAESIEGGGLTVLCAGWSAHSSPTATCTGPRMGMAWGATQSPSGILAYSKPHRCPESAEAAGTACRAGLASRPRATSGARARQGGARHQGTNRRPARGGGRRDGAHAAAAARAARRPLPQRRAGAAAGRQGRERPGRRALPGQLEGECVGRVRDRGGEAGGHGAAAAVRGGAGGDAAGPGARPCRVSPLPQVMPRAHARAGKGGGGGGGGGRGAGGYSACAGGGGEATDKQAGRLYCRPRKCPPGGPERAPGCAKGCCSDSRHIVTSQHCEGGAAWTCSAPGRRRACCTRA